MSDDAGVGGGKGFTPVSVAASHTAIALSVEAFVRSPQPDQHLLLPAEAREALADHLDEKFREVFGLLDDPEDLHDLHRIWEALRTTLRSETLEKYSN